MRADALDLAILATVSAAGLGFLKRDKGDPGPKPSGEKNTYGLPVGGPIAKKLKAQYDKIAKEVLGTLATFDHVPDHLPTLKAHEPELTRAMTPLLGVYWDASGKKTMGRLGLDPDAWQVTNPHLKHQIEQQAFDFCDSTLATTTEEINTAQARLKAELAAGLVDAGEALPELRKRVQAVFGRMADWKADQIAATEASRAVHGAQLEADRQSGVVAGVELLLSADACPLCRMVATEARRVKLGDDFAVIGHNPTYRNVKHPPIHVHCQCALIEVLKPEWGGPENPEWAAPLVQPKPGADYTPPEGKATPEPEPEKLKNPPAATKTPETADDILAVRRGRVRERLAAIEAALKEGDAEVDRTKAAFLAATPGSAEWDAALKAHQEALGRRARRKDLKGLEAVKARLEQWEAMVKEVPTLVPAGPIGERIAEYAGGEAKRQAFLGHAGDLRGRRAALDAELASFGPRDAALRAEWAAIHQDARHLTGRTPAEEATFAALAAREKQIIAAVAAIRAREPIALAELAEVKAAARAPLLKVLAADTPIDLKFRTGPGKNAYGDDLEPLEGESLRKGKDARNFITAIARAGEAPVSTHVALVAASGAQRAHQDSNRDYIQVARDDDTRTYVHEMGHLLDDRLALGGQSALARSQEFLAHRVGDEVPTHMSVVAPRIKWGPREFGRKDKFEEVFGPVSSYYVGKDYGDIGTEILSMGLEKLYDDPLLLAEKDPEFFKFVVGILDGSLR